MDVSRRGVLQLFGGVGVTSLAGCSSDPSDRLVEKSPTRIDDGSGTGAESGVIDPATTLEVVGTGNSIGISRDGTTAVVGNPTDPAPAGSNSGSVVVFSRKGTSWTQTSKVTAPDGSEQAYFGDAVSLAADGATLAVGATRATNEAGVETGSVYVFKEESDGWAFETKLVSETANESAEFGRAVAPSPDGRTILVGAPMATNAEGVETGLVSVFEKRSDSWQERTTLSDAEGVQYGEFGAAIAVSGAGQAIVGAPHNLWVDGPEGDEELESGPGAVTIFRRTEDSWAQSARFKLVSGRASDEFGKAVDIAADGTTAVVGAPSRNDPEINAGSVLLFRQREEEPGWERLFRLAPADPDAGDTFGSAVAIGADGLNLLIGARLDEDPYGARAGSAYLFTRPDHAPAWEQQAKFSVDPSPYTGPSFGYTTAIDGDGSTILVGTLDGNSVYAYRDDQIE
jgi:hypothetical protein